MNKSDFDKQAIVKELREHNARQQAMAKAIRENLKARPDYSAFRWKSFLALGVVCAVYFASLAFTDKVNFRDGMAILRRVAFQSVSLIAIWAGVVWAYKTATPGTQKKIEKTFFASCIALALVVMLLVLGFGSRTGRSLWMNGPFVVSLALEVSAWIFLFRWVRQVREKLTLGEEVLPANPWLRIYAAEGALLYLTPAIFLQAVFHIHVPMILGMLVRKPAALFLFCIPYLGYVFFRKVLGER